MGLPSFFKLNSYRVFDYKPLYYDEKKEEREKRNESIKRELGLSDENGYKPNIKGQMQRIYSERKKVQKSSNIRLIIILFALIALAYYLFFS